MNFRHRIYSDGWPSDRESFAAKLKRTRVVAGLGRRQLAELTGLNYFTLLHIERGENLPSPDHRARLIRALEPFAGPSNVGTDEKEDKP